MLIMPLIAFSLFLVSIQGVLAGQRTSLLAVDGKWLTVKVRIVT